MPRTSHNINNRYKYQGIFMSAIVESSAVRVADFDDMHPDWQASLILMNSSISGTGLQGKFLNKLLTGIQSAMPLIVANESHKDCQDRLEIQSSLFRFLMKKYVHYTYKLVKILTIFIDSRHHPETTSKGVNWTKSTDKLFTDFATFFNDCLDCEAYIIPSKMKCYIECLLAFAQSTHCNLRLEIVGQFLPFVLAYLGCSYTDMDATRLGVFMHDSQDGGSKYRVLFYKTQDNILCYGLDVVNHQFVQVGIIKWENGRVRLAYTEHGAWEPRAIPMSRNDVTDAGSTFLFTSYELYAMWMPAEARVQPQQTRTAVDLLSDSDDVDTIDPTDLFPDDEKSVGSGKDNVIDQAIMAAFGLQVVEDEFTKFSNVLADGFCKEASVQPGDNVHRFEADVAKILFEEFDEYRCDFIGYVTRMQKEDKMWFHEAVFLNLVLQYAHHCDAEFPTTSLCAQLPKFKELITLATAKHEAVVEQMKMEAYRQVATAHVPVASRFLSAVRAKYSSFMSFGKLPTHNDQHFEHRVQTGIDDCHTRRRDLFQQIQFIYDDKLTAVRHIRDVLRLNQSLTMMSLPSVGAMDTGDA